MTVVREATIEDLESIVQLTRSQRNQLAEWSPVYFNPRDGADEGHAGFLSFIVTSRDHDTFVLDGDDDVFGFFVNVHQDRHLWVDDLCIDSHIRWPETVRCLVESTASPWVTCVAMADRHRRSELAKAGLKELSTYYARKTSDIVPLAATAAVIASPPDRETPSHTFGGRPFSPALAGALVVDDNQGGYVVGSPSVTPPIYDPGGPTCVIDQIVGADRHTLVRDALAVAAGRGDAQVIVVCGHDDEQLIEILKSSGFTAEVTLIGS